MSKMRELQDEFIAKEALKLFLKSSIAGVTMAMIAKEVGVGEATLYRHFTTKQNIVLRSVLILANSVLEEFKEIKEESGYKELEAFFNIYYDTFKNNKEFFSFINEFDAFILQEGFEAKGYDENILSFKDSFIKSYNKGLNDNTVNKIDDIDTFYFATTQSLLNLCKKLAQKAIVKSDESISKENEIRALIDIILYRLKKN
ncbi:MAG: TetR/AcrR family transcriptional regulator [Acholeplasmatales bacterium]|nr:TetR/AcrR family transcriptional regulator [Acholeplasmatales bacterium]